MSECHQTIQRKCASLTARAGADLSVPYLHRKQAFCHSVHTAIFYSDCRCSWIPTLGSCSFPVAGDISGIAERGGGRLGSAVSKRWRRSTASAAILATLFFSSPTTRRTPPTIGPLHLKGIQDMNDVLRPAAAERPLAPPSVKPSGRRANTPPVGSCLLLSGAEYCSECCRWWTGDCRWEAMGSVEVVKHLRCSTESVSRMQEKSIPIMQKFTCQDAGRDTEAHTCAKF